MTKTGLPPIPEALERDDLVTADTSWVSASTDFVEFRAAAETQHHRMRLYFSPARPRAITLAAWAALKHTYKNWRDEHVGRVVSALADLLLADLAALPPQE